ncbi:hypothetical protein [Teredinibacter turnerae]|uniref:hypothetical protein n=1 Tax=Teredinibacter turnerae TaxID=2426 RepID=UPI00035F73FB|nr:hypothetical protein [Teredinibacter turnerae]
MKHCIKNNISTRKYICIAVAFSCISLSFASYADETKSVVEPTNSPSISETKKDQESVFDQKLEEMQTKISDQLDDIYREVQFLKGKATEDKKDWVTPTLSLIGVFLGVIAGGIVNHKLQMSQKRFEICKSLMDWKVKQLSELYGPLHALLHQSSALYRHMNNVLINSDTNKFRLSSDPTNGDFDMKVFQIFENNAWIDFRTVTHIDSVYGHNFNIEQYFDEIIKIGERMVKIIEDKAGYVREDQPELAEIFGQYLAHYAVLRKIHHERQRVFNNPKYDKEQSTTISADESAAFPRNIQKLVQKGYKDLNTELNNWGEQGNMLSTQKNS